MKILIFSLLIVSLVYANTEEDKLKKTALKPLVKQRQEIKHQIDSFTTGIDQFLTGREFSNRPNRTKLTISNQFNFKEAGEVEYQPLVNVDLHLPNLEKLIQVKLSSYDVAERNEGVDKNRIEEKSSEESFGTSVNFFKEINKFKLQFRPRLEFSPVVGISYLLKFSLKQAISQRIFFEPTLSFLAQPDDGTSQYTSLNIVNYVSRKSKFTFINEWEYQNIDHTLQANNGFSISNDYNSRISFLHMLIFESNNRPTYNLDNIVLSTGYFHKLYKGIIHYSLRPYVSFAREYEFRQKFGVQFHLNLIF